MINILKMTDIGEETIVKDIFDTKKMYFLKKKLTYHITLHYVHLHGQSLRFENKCYSQYYLEDEIKTISDDIKCKTLCCSSPLRKSC